MPLKTPAGVLRYRNATLEDLTGAALDNWHRLIELELAGCTRNTAKYQTARRNYRLSLNRLGLAVEQVNGPYSYIRFKPRYQMVGGKVCKVA